MYNKNNSTMTYMSSIMLDWCLKYAIIALKICLKTSPRYHCDDTARSFDLPFQTSLV